MYYQGYPDVRGTLVTRRFSNGIWSVKWDTLTWRPHLVNERRIVPLPLLDRIVEEIS